MVKRLRDRRLGLAPKKQSRLGDPYFKRKVDGTVVRRDGGGTVLMVSCPHCGRWPGLVVANVSGCNVVVSNRLVLINDVGSCDVPAPIDLDLLTRVIEPLEDELSSSAMVLTPADKAGAIVGLYELALEDAAGDVPPDAPGDAS